MLAKNARDGLNLDGISNWRSCPMALDVVRLTHPVAQSSFLICFPDHCFLTCSTWEGDAQRLAVAVAGEPLNLRIECTLTC